MAMNQLSVGQLRITGFPSEGVEAHFDLSSLKEERKHTQSHDPQKRITTTEITFDAFTIKYVTRPGRYDFVVSVPELTPDRIVPSTRLLGSLDELVPMFDQLRAICEESSPPVVRCAVGTTLFAFPENHADAFKIAARLAPFLNNPVVENSRLEDFSLSINLRRREHRVGQTRSDVNRIFKLWVQEFFQHSVTLKVGSADTPSQEISDGFIQIKAETDVNNVPEGNSWNATQVGAALASFFVETRELTQGPRA